VPNDALAQIVEAFAAAAEEVAHARPEVDLELALEVMLEAAHLLHNGLALEGLDEHDSGAVVAGLSAALVDEDPGDAVRARSRAALDQPADLHDPASVSAAYLVAAAVLQV
jgi:hypothetical protein